MAGLSAQDRPGAWGAPGVRVTDLAQVPGWFARPEVPGRVPAVLLLHPSSAWDRRALIPAEESGTGRDVYLFDDLAAALLRAGVAVLGFDSRFVTARRGDGWEPGLVTFPALIQDAVALLRYLQEHPGVDPDRISLLGVSLGTQVAVGAAVQAAAEARAAGGSARPCRLILAAPGVQPLDQHLAWSMVGRRLEWLLAAGLVDRGGNVDLRRVAERRAARFGWWDEFDPSHFTPVPGPHTGPGAQPGPDPDLVPYEQVAGVLLHRHDEFVRRIFRSGGDGAPAEYWRTRRDRPPMAELLAQLTGRVWVHVGDDDWTTPPRQSWQLARCAPEGLDVQVTVHPDLGHLFSPRDRDGRMTYGPIDPSVLAALTASALAV